MSDSKFTLTRKGTDYQFTLTEKYYDIRGIGWTEQNGQFSPVERFIIMDPVTGKTLQHKGKRLFNTAAQAIKIAASRAGWQTRYVVVPITVYACNDIEHIDHKESTW